MGGRTHLFRQPGCVGAEQGNASALASDFAKLLAHIPVYAVPPRSLVPSQPVQLAAPLLLLRTEDAVCCPFDRSFERILVRGPLRKIREWYDWRGARKCSRDDVRSEDKVGVKRRSTRGRRECRGVDAQRRRLEREQRLRVTGRKVARFGRRKSEHIWADGSHFARCACAQIRLDYEG